jgi:diguanylate cyclase (GGDEF)-like protein/PAS domain S-box-containing protein
LLLTYAGDTPIRACFLENFAFVNTPWPHLLHLHDKAHDATLPEWWSAILQSANLSIIATDESGLILSFNPAAERMLGYRAEEVLGQQTPALFHDPQEVIERARYLSGVNNQPVAPGFDVFVAQARRGVAEEREWTYIRKDGQRLTVLLSVTAIHSAEGNIRGFLGIAADISERKRQEKKLSEVRQRKLSVFEQRLRLAEKVFEYSSEAIMVTDASGVIIRINPAFTHLTGYTSSEALGQTPRLLSSGRHDAAFYQHMWEALLNEGQWSGEVWDRRKDGTIYPKWAVINAVREAGVTTHFVAVFVDISERKEADERIHYLAYHDHLTGLANRLMFEQRMQHAMARAERNGTRMALIFIDLDRFKNINDSLGHQFGDQLLIEAARRLRAAVRVSDTVARLGGDEFLVVLENVGDQNRCAHLVVKLQEELAQAYAINDTQVHAPPSMGVAIYPTDGTDVQTLMKHADMAMYQVKAQGRNAWAFFAPAMNQAVQERLRLENDLRQALAREEFVVHYQPQWAIDTRRLIGWEALVRWQHPQHGLVPPDKFIPIAEETGLIVALGEWVLAAACAQAVAWQAAGFGPQLMAVNLSARQFTERNLLERIDAVLEKTAFPAAQLELEITESVLMNDAEQTISILRSLKQRGVHIAIDDFGTGYSSLAYLKAFPADKLKIDRSFVRDVDDDANDAAIVCAIISLAHSLGLATLAEGVETEAQRKFLDEHGCQAQQGYLWGKPLTAEDAEALLRSLTAAGD